ncbi:MAG: hypothetical protein WD646_02830 [Actinomycetota bacterium]
MILLAVSSTLGGCVVMAAALRWSGSILSGARHHKLNYRGRNVLATAGVLLLGPVGVGALAALNGISDEGYRVAGTMASAVAVMCVLGLIDDLYGSRRAGGLAGHFRELLNGHMTTGMVKAAGGVVVGLASAWGIGRRGIWILVGGAVIALAANMANLLDLRPGRTAKVWFPCAFALGWLNVPGRGEPVLWAVAGGMAVFLIAELRERVMLGDAGANLLGAVVGAAAVASLGHTALLTCAALLFALTLVSELVSFSRIIEATPPLRWLDQLGRAD